MRYISWLHRCYSCEGKMESVSLFYDFTLNIMVTVHLNIRADGLSTFYRNQMMNMKMNKDHNSK